jgi:hypothetical protein
MGDERRNRTGHHPTGDRHRMKSAPRSATARPVESRMLRNGHVRFGGRVEETDRR